MPDPIALGERLLGVIERGAAHRIDDAEFSDLALEVFAHQFARNAPYRAYCESRGATPWKISSWLDIPAVPTDAFKAAALVAGDPADARAVFRTSGTTAGHERRGTHYFLDLTLYEAALLRGFEAAVLPDGARLPILSLVPPAAEQPDSSLSHMATTLVDHFGGPGSQWVVSAEDGLRLDQLVGSLSRADAHRDSVILIGTSLAFVHLFDAMTAEGRRVELPHGSRVMDTGGFKGRTRVVARDEILEMFESSLGIPAERVFNEYGMTEMSSQLYAAGSGMHNGPGWLRTRAVDPETLQMLPDGEIGVLRHWDLANIDSVAVLQTADLGRVSADGVEVIGRARGAEARGCSIAMDELLTVLRRR